MGGSCLCSHCLPSVQRVARVLWNQLNKETREHHITCVELFYRLHCLAPTANICEDIICHALLDPDKVSLCSRQPPSDIGPDTVSPDRLTYIRPESFWGSVDILINGQAYGISNIFFFLAVLGLRCCVQSFSSCGERGPLLAMVHRPFTAVASLVAEHGL